MKTILRKLKKGSVVSFFFSTTIFSKAISTVNALYHIYCTAVVIYSIDKAKYNLLVSTWLISTSLYIIKWMKCNYVVNIVTVGHIIKVGHSLIMNNPSIDFCSGAAKSTTVLYIKSEGLIDTNTKVWVMVEKNWFIKHDVWPCPKEKVFIAVLNGQNWRQGEMSLYQSINMDKGAHFQTISLWRLSSCWTQLYNKRKKRARVRSSNFTAWSGCECRTENTTNIWQFNKR